MPSPLWVSLIQPFDSLQRARRLSKGNCILSACLQGHKSDFSCLWTQTQTGTIPSALPDYQLAELQILGLFSYHNYVTQLFVTTLSIYLFIYHPSTYPFKCFCFFGGPRLIHCLILLETSPSGGKLMILVSFQNTDTERVFLAQLGAASIPGQSALVKRQDHIVVM